MCLVHQAEATNTARCQKKKKDKLMVTKTLPGYHIFNMFSQLVSQTAADTCQHSISWFWVQLGAMTILFSPTRILHVLKWGVLFERSLTTTGHSPSTGE
jgi:hypothetical protein